MSSSDFFRKYQPLFESKDKETYAAKQRKIHDAATKELNKNKKPTNVKETAAEFFRKYSDMVVEAEELDNNKKIEEKWDTETKIAPSKKGMFKGKTKAELKSQLSKLKASGPHKLGSKENTKMKELNFALRAKSGWGKVEEGEQVNEATKCPICRKPQKENTEGNPKYCQGHD